MKIRFKTWYWGKFIYNRSKLDGSIVTINTDGFEEYIEELHGIQNENTKTDLG